MVAPQQTKLEKMRDFYEIFPYPGRFVIFQPDISRSVFTHAGFSQALAHRQFSFCGKLVEKVSVRGQAHVRFDDEVFKTLNKNFLSDKRLLSVGCGTDEPLLMKKLHPNNEIVCIDLSFKSLQKARVKLFLYHVRTFFRKHIANVSLICGDATELLAKKRFGTFDHIQCFGVLHHQPNPELLFEAMARSLVPGGTLRLMIYSHTGRRLERGIQRRYSFLWDAESPMRNRMKIRLENLRLLLWQVGNRFNPFARGHMRFRYLGMNSSSVADALMHPSDPGLKIEKLVEWAERFGLKFIYCEAKTEKHGWVRELVNVTPAVENLAAVDNAHGLQSNFVCILKKESHDKALL